MKHFSGVAIICFLLCGTDACFPATPIDGRTAARWEPQPHWSPGREALRYSLKGTDGWLDLSLEGDDSLMTWTYRPTPDELLCEPRYLVLRYRAFNLQKQGSSYFLSARDGSPGWRHFLVGADIAADGEEHVSVIDVLSYSPPAPINQLALRIGPPIGGRGRLLAKIEFTNDLPSGTEPRTAPRVEPEKVRIEMEDIKWSPSANWTPHPPEKHGMQATDLGVRFHTIGQNRSMRWSAAVPEEIDVGTKPFVSIRYRAKGKFGPWGYAFYMSVVDAKGEKVGTYPMKPGDVEGEGRWHVFHTQIEQKGVGNTMAVGIDSLSPEAEIEIDYVEYSSRPQKTPIDEILGFEKRTTTWPNGEGGLVTVPVPESDTPPNHFMISRMGIGSWFDTRHVTVEGVPFEIPAEPSDMLASGTVGEDKLSLDLPPKTTEVLLLLAASFPRDELFGSSWRTRTPLPLLSEPERLTVELVYADGTSDHMLPIHLAKATYGVGHDLAVYAVRPSPGMSPIRLVLHDNMRNAAFGIIGVTANTATPRGAVPDTQEVWYPPVNKPPLSDAAVSFTSDRGLTWAGIESPMLRGRIQLQDSPVFLLKLGDDEIPSSQWMIEDVNRDGDNFRAGVTYTKGDVRLRANFLATKEGQNSVRLSLDLTNVGNAPVTGTLFFPNVSGLKIGSVEQTWYFCARRGGVINRVPCNWRDEIGEAHPLQVDGFFNPAVGAGVSFMPRDGDEVFRWYHVNKDATGGGYALEFLPETVAPGEKWKSVPVLVAVVPGDWKDQLQSYLDWVKTWYKPAVPRKQWFRELFAFGPGDPTSNMNIPLEQRIDFVAKTQKIRDAIGACDYMHLFGWAKTEQYGHWGDYDHYDAVGGRERFVEQVRRSQEAGIPVGLYLDGYLVAQQSLKPTKEQRSKWAVRKSDGEMLYHDSYDAHSMCPYVPEWRDYLSRVYRRVAEEVEPDGMYLDELGKCMVHRTCYATDHGHPSPMGMSPGERLLIRQIREAVPPNIATYCEYIPADVTSQYIDGGFGHVPLYGWRDGYDEVASHYVNLQRFAFPDFKTFQLIYYVPQENGNWFLLKYPFFNGDGYYLTTACVMSDDHAQAFYRNAFRVLHEHADAFASEDVEPLVRTEHPGLYANRFSTAAKTVWTLFNANYQTVRGKLLVVPHKPGTTYEDSWNRIPIPFTVAGDKAVLSLQIGPRGVGCVVQSSSKSPNHAAP